MKRIFFSLVMAVQSLVWSGEALSAPCASSSVTSYVALGASGCTIGSFVFSDFALLPPAAGAVASSSITVTPLMVGSTMVGVSFGVAPLSSNGLYYDNLVSYRVNGVAANLTGATVDFTGSGTTGDAAVSVAESLCLGGTFLGADGVSGCSSGNRLDLAVIDIGFGADPAYTLGFAPIGSLAVVTDIAYDSGSGSGFVPGSGSTLTSAIKLFSVVAAPRAVPEPAAGLLMLAGLFAAVRARRRPRAS